MFAFDVPLKLLRQIARFARNDLIDKLVGLAFRPNTRQTPLALKR